MAMKFRISIDISLKITHPVPKENPPPAGACGLGAPNENVDMASGQDAKTGRNRKETVDLTRAGTGLRIVVKTLSRGVEYIQAEMNISNIPEYY